MLRKTCVICHPRLSTWVTLGVALMLPLVLNAVPAIAAVTVEVTVSQQIYQPNAVQVKSNVTISGVKNTKGTLYVSTVKEQGEELVDERRYPITLDNDGIVTQPYDIAPLPEPDASYTILATFIEEDNTIAEAHARFGIRPEGFPAGVPDHILYTRVPSLSVPDILDRLEQGAKPSNKEPVELRIGSEVIKVRVEKQELLAKGVEIPNLGRPPVFAGQLIDEDGVEVPGSSVVFTVTNGQSGVMQLGGMVKTPVTGADTPPSAFDAMWIEPLGLLTRDHNDAPPPEDRHLMYHTKDTVMPPNLLKHLDNPPIVLESEGELPFQLEEETLSLDPIIQATVPTYKYTVEIQVYEDHDGWGSHWDLLVFWANELRNKFVNILRRTGTNKVTVADVVYSKWRQVPASDFDFFALCDHNMRTFKQNTEAGRYGAIRPHTLQILFTTLADCGGYGPLGNSFVAGESNRRMYSLTVDSFGFAMNAIILLQETGHNLDWHPEWSTSEPNPHDSHTSSQISQAYNHTHFLFFNSVHCTAMRGSYGGCTEPQATYTFGNLSPLQHLAEGIAEMFR